MLFLAVILFALAVVALVVGAAGLTGTLPGNRYVGVTTEPALRTEAAWRLANRVAGPTTLVAGVLLAVGALAAMVMGGIVGLLVALVATGTALFTAGSGVSLGTRAAEAITPPQEAGGATGDGCGAQCGCGTEPETAPETDCGQACGSCSLAGACQSQSV